MLTPEQADVLLSIDRHQARLERQTSNAYLVTVPIGIGRGPHDYGWAFDEIIMPVALRGGVLDSPFLAWSQVKVISADYEAVGAGQGRLRGWSLSIGSSHTSAARDPSVGPELLSLLARLEWFGTFEYNWNGEGGLAIPPEVLREGERLLTSSVLLEHPPELFATGRGSIQFEYERENGDYLEVEVFPERFVVLVEQPANEFRQFETSQWQDVADAISAFHES